MKRICLSLAVLLCLVTVQSFAEDSEPDACVFPFDVSEPWIELENGAFSCSIRNPDTVTADGKLTLDLYLEDRYNTDVLMALNPGDTVWVAGKVLTVKEFTLREVDSKIGFEFELVPEEEVFAYVVFVPLTNGTSIAIVDDWSPVVELGSIDISLPLRDDFRYVAYSAGMANEPAGQDVLLKDLAAYGDFFVPYNTTCVIVGGELWELDHSPYPAGPEEDTAETSADNADAVPVWKFFHARSAEGLDTAVITCWQSDCEAGLIPQELSESDESFIRDLALNGYVTDLASDLSVTGGTWVYAFETPEGEHLLSVELYKGMLVGPYGMYNYTK